MEWSDRVVLVTGGGSGIGAAVCERFAAAGARVVVADLDVGSARGVAGPIGAEAVELDVTDAAAVDRTIGALDRLDVLVTSAGVDDPPIKQLVARQVAAGDPVDVTPSLSDERWRRTLSVNLDGTFFCVRAGLRRMLEQGSGSIVTVASAAGVNPVPGLPHYCASKAGVIALTRSVAKEVASRGVRVNAVAPGAVDTPMAARTPPGVGPSIPLGRVATPAEIAAAVLFLAGDEAGYVTGEVLNVNGGTVTA